MFSMSTVRKAAEPRSPPGNLHFSRLVGSEPRPAQGTGHHCGGIDSPAANSVSTSPRRA